MPIIRFLFLALVICPAPAPAETTSVQWTAVVPCNPVHHGECPPPKDPNEPGDSTPTLPQ